jgi:hypothetical protein
VNKRQRAASWTARRARLDQEEVGIGAIGLIALFGWVVMALWNWLVPDIFGFKRIGYWQAGGLLVLCWILFKGIRLGSNSNSSNDRRRRQELRRHMEADRTTEKEGT